MFDSTLRSFISNFLFNINEKIFFELNVIFSKLKFGSNSLTKSSIFFFDSDILLLFTKALTKKLLSFFLIDIFSDKKFILLKLKDESFAVNCSFSISKMKLISFK